MIRVLVVEDSATVRRHLVTLLNAAGDFEVVAQVSTAAEAVRAAAALEPDLVSLDVFLPDGSAAQVVAQILKGRRVPILLLSDAPRNADEVFRALEAGASDFMSKPKPGHRASTTAMLTSMRALSRMRMDGGPRLTAAAGSTSLSVLVVVASTGGPGILRSMLGALPARFALPIVIAQHLSAGFEEGMARWLAEGSHLEVRVATPGAKLRRGRAYLGTSGTDVVIATGGALEVSPALPHGYHPSGDALFSSAVDVFGGGVAAVVLSGVGSDGLRGARRVIDAGGVVFAQDPEAAAVGSMPRAVLQAGLASKCGTPENLAKAIVGALESRGVAERSRPYIEEVQ